MAGPTKWSRRFESWRSMSPQVVCAVSHRRLLHVPARRTPDRHCKPWSEWSDSSRRERLHGRSSGRRVRPRRASAPEVVAAARGSSHRGGDGGRPARRGRRFTAERRGASGSAPDGRERRNARHHRRFRPFDPCHPGRGNAIRSGAGRDCTCGRDPSASRSAHCPDHRPIRVSRRVAPERRSGRRPRGSRGVADRLDQLRRRRVRSWRGCRIAHGHAEEHGSHAAQNRRTTRRIVEYGEQRALRSQESHDVRHVCRSAARRRADAPVHGGRPSSHPSLSLGDVSALRIVDSTGAARDVQRHALYVGCRDLRAWRPPGNPDRRFDRGVR